MFTSLDTELVRERNERLLREVLAERFWRRLRADRGRRSGAWWIARLLPPRRGSEPPTGTPRWIGEETAAEEA